MHPYRLSSDCLAELTSPIRDGTILNVPRENISEGERRHLMTTWFITGISRGLGFALAKAVLADGDTVIGTVRSGKPDLAAGRGALQIITVDLADGAAAEAAV